MQKLNRRKFLGQTSAAAAGITAFPNIIPSSALGADGNVAPSNRIVMGCIGVGGQGTGNMNAFLGSPEMQIVAVCDVDNNHRKRAQDIVNKKYGNSDCATFDDFRALLADKSIDTVTVCTPDHWHALASIAAAEAGKDIYCEKPLTNTIAGGKAVYAAVKRYGRILQTGSHERSRPNARLACELVRNGRIGKVHTIEVNLPCDQEHHLSVLNDRKVYTPLPVPGEFDYNMWLGPAPDAPYMEKRCHFWWRFILDYGGGEMTDRGAHVIDLAQLGNNTDHTTPIELWAKGDRTDSNLWNAFFNYNFECKYANGVTMIGSGNSPRGVKFIGTDGWIFIHVHGGHLEASSQELLLERLGPNEESLGRSTGHHANFIASVKSRKQPFASAMIGHHTATICHLLNISMQLGGRKLKWDPEKEEITNDPGANRLLCRSFRSPWTLG